MNPKAILHVVAALIVLCAPACVPTQPSPAKSSTEEPEAETLNKRFWATETPMRGVVVVNKGLGQGSELLEHFGLRNSTLIEVLSEQQLQFSCTFNSENPDWRGFEPSSEKPTLYQYFIRVTSDREGARLKTSCFVAQHMSINTDLDEALSMPENQMVPVGFQHWSSRTQWDNEFALTAIEKGFWSVSTTVQPKDDSGVFSIYRWSLNNEHESLDTLTLNVRFARVDESVERASVTADAQ